MSADNPYPSYLEMRQPLPRYVWHVLRVIAVLGAFTVIALLFFSPRTGLKLWWLWILPCLPLSLVLVPGIWRNICPIAALNQVPRLVGFARNLRVPPWLRRHQILIQMTFYFALISMRAPLFDHSGPALGVLMLIALAAAFAGGVVFIGKSGWCGTFCPLMPIQRPYGQTPTIVVPVTPWLNTLATAIDRDRREVVLGVGDRLPYDWLILATGAEAFIPPLEGSALPGVFAMRTADDAIRIRAYSRRTGARSAQRRIASAQQRLAGTDAVRGLPRSCDGSLDRRCGTLAASGLVPSALAFDPPPVPRRSPAGQGRKSV